MRISLVIPAWNEEAFLPRLLESVAIAANRFHPGKDLIEVIVADNGSTDRTAALAEQAGCKVVPVSKRCIAAARNGGAARATGELLAFADADFRIAPTTFDYIDQVMQHPGVIGGATGLTMERWSLGITVAWCLVLPPLRLCGLDGGVWFCRRVDFESVGGFDEDRRAGEDVMWLRSLQRLGKKRTPREKLVTRSAARRFGLQPALVVNSARKFDMHGDWHLLRDLLVNVPRLVFHRKAVHAYVDRYWYQGRGHTSDNE